MKSTLEFTKLFSRILHFLQEPWAACIIIIISTLSSLFTDKENKVQRNEVLWQRSQNDYVVKQRGEPSLVPPTWICCSTLGNIKLGLYHW